MLLLLLLVASSGMVLAKPRVKGSPLAQSSSPHSYQPQYYSAPEQGQEAGPGYKPAVQIVSQADAGDSDSVLIKISQKDLQHFKVQQHGSPLHSPKPSTVDNRDVQVPVIPDAQFTVPSIPNVNVQSKQGHNSNSQYRVQPNFEITDVQSPHYSAASHDSGTQRRKRLQDSLVESTIQNLMRSTPGNARLIATNPSLAPLNDRLIDNYTLIIENPVDTFRCEGLDYGYYADVDNQCKIFHVCLPLHQLYPDTFGESVTYQFSFVCPKYTIFSQDAMVCAWEVDAIPCELSPELYWLNKNFFRKVIKGSEEVYAHVNEPYP